MRHWRVILLMLILAVPAMASITGNTSQTVKDPGAPYVNPSPLVRVTGDTISDPFLLTGLGTVTGTTAGFTNDYDEMCPYGSNAPDVVYAWTVTADINVNIDLCFSSYDTKILVYDNAFTPGTPYACNDDYWSEAPCYVYSSRIADLPLVAGHTYYIVVDGYGNYSGTYQMDITDAGPQQPVVCPEGAWIENEPPCADGYVDGYNAGCGGMPETWQPLNPQTAGCATMCGKSCTFVISGMYLRDTDWFESIGSGGPVTATCIAEFPLQFMLIYGTDCSALTWVIGNTGPGVPITLTWPVAAGDAIWIWVGNQHFWGWAESNYVLSVCGLQDPPPPPGACCNDAGGCIVASPDACASMGGIFQGNPTCVPSPCEGTPAKRRSWGAVKNLYR